jgi:hypothetical protein
MGMFIIRAAIGEDKSILYYYLNKKQKMYRKWRAHNFQKRLFVIYVICSKISELLK